MTHDEFCNCLGNESECEPLSATDPICIHCECPFIERVRADEREKAAERITEQSGYMLIDPLDLKYVIAAARGGEQA